MRVVQMFAFMLSLVHFSLIATIILIIIFSDNVLCIIATNSVLFGVLLLNYTFKDCPLSLIEDKYFDDSLIDKMVKPNIYILGLHYTKDERAFVTLELIWIMLMIGIQRVLYLLFFQQLTMKSFFKKVSSLTFT
jgi:hypothetical protein